MESLYDLILKIERPQWDYYWGMNEYNDINNPFINSSLTTHSEFIEKYFKRGGKIDVFERSDINIRNLRLPNHINSVFFLGIIIFHNTSFLKRYNFGINKPGYQTFPFIWFLVALFHDNAYQIENDQALINKVVSLEDILQIYDISKNLFSLKNNTLPKCDILLNSRKNYFKYRCQECRKIDHGLIGSLLLYDRLLKIRREKEKSNDDKRFWHKSLMRQYRLAADAISIHNIWLPNDKNRSLYHKHGLNDMDQLTPVSFRNFPLFYLLALVDTIEPLKLYSRNNPSLSDDDILKNIKVGFKDHIILISVNEDFLKFNVIYKQVKGLQEWLNVDIKEINKNTLKIEFN